jgi:hypothetical protein
MTASTARRKALEMELRITRLEGILASVIKENGDAPLRELWANTRADVIRLFPESGIK